MSYLHEKNIKYTLSDEYQLLRFKYRKVWPNFN